MLLSLTISNFRSFREEQTLSMVASNRYPDHTEHLTPIPDDEGKALPVAVLYGANGAGKSNLVKALAFLRQLILRGVEPGKPLGQQPFRFDRTSATQPTEISVQFIEGGTAFVYGVRLSEKFVQAEWLSVLRGGKEVSVFERLTEESGIVKIEAGPVLTEDTWGNHSKALAFSRVGVLPNRPFLHALLSNIRSEEQGPVVAAAIRWFTERLTIISPDARFGGLAQLIASDDEFAAFAGEFLRQVATGVDRLSVEVAEVESSALAGLGFTARKIVEDLQSGDTAEIMAMDGADLVVQKTEAGRINIRTVKAEHLTADGDRIQLPFPEESDGTQRLTHLLPALHALKKGPRIFVVDEIDRSLHPLLAKGFVRTFLQAGPAAGGQLIFTTHETAFLDLELLRRDEIWFADKVRQSGATTLYSLADYKVRTDKRIDKAYLEGRYEAVPPISDELPDWVKRIIRELGPQSRSKGEALA